LLFFFIFGLYGILRVGLLHHPVKYVVVLVTHSVKKIFEQFPQVSDVRFLLELERAAVS
jgi:hypothetical protein